LCDECSDVAAAVPQKMNEKARKNYEIWKCWKKKGEKERKREKWE
jgi:hypothetical protein